MISTSQVGSWTSDGNTIDITLVCGDEYNGPGSNTYSFIGLG